MFMVSHWTSREQNVSLSFPMHAWLLDWTLDTISHFLMLVSCSMICYIISLLWHSLLHNCIPFRNPSLLVDVLGSRLVFAKFPRDITCSCILGSLLGFCHMWIKFLRIVTRSLVFQILTDGRMLFSLSHFHRLNTISRINKENIVFFICYVSYMLPSFQNYLW